MSMRGGEGGGGREVGGKRERERERGGGERERGGEVGEREGEREDNLVQLIAYNHSPQQ